MRTAFREPDRHIFMTLFIFHFLESDIVREYQRTGKEKKQSTRSCETVRG